MGPRTPSDRSANRAFVAPISPSSTCSREQPISDSCEWLARTDPTAAIDITLGSFLDSFIQAALQRAAVVFVAKDRLQNQAPSMRCGRGLAGDDHLARQ